MPAYGIRKMDLETQCNPWTSKDPHHDTPGANRAATAAAAAARAAEDAAAIAGTGRERMWNDSG